MGIRSVIALDQPTRGPSAALRATAWLWLAFAVLAACGDNIEPEPDPDVAVVVALETSAPTQVAAGDEIAVNCTLLENDVVTPVTAQIRAVDEAAVIRMGSDIIARRVGVVEVSCALPDRGIVDPTPSLVEIVAGTAANVVTTITPDPVVAGNDVTATCVVYDAYGNLIDDAAPTLQLSPMDAANTITGLSAEMIRAGHYTGRCELPGTTTNNAGFNVIPNLPATLLVQRWPDLPVYAVGNGVEVTHIVSDRYGNEIFPAAVTKTIATITGVGPIVNLGAGNWRFDGEGRYRVTATVDPPTDMDIPLTATVDIVVNSRGPAITCANDATMVNHPPGVSMPVTGNANDVNGVAALTVNGNPVAIAGDGSFATTVPTRFGMNFVRVQATDSFGEPTSKVCTFLVSNRYVAGTSFATDAVSLKMSQAAVDDNNRAGEINSLDDILWTIINSSGMSTTIHNTMLAANPLKPHACDSQTCVPFIGCACWYSSGVEYRNRDLPGPNTVSLTLVNGGLRAQVRIPNIGVNLRLWGRVGPVPYDTTGWVRVSYVDVGVTLDVGVSAGQPNLTVRAGSVTTDVGTVSTEFNGVDGWIINNIVVPLARDYIREELRKLIRDFITNNFNAALDGVLGNLNIATLGTSFNVPRIDGGQAVTLAFGLELSTLNTTASRLLFGIGTRFTSPVTNPMQTLGVPQPVGLNITDATLTNPSNTLVGAHVSVLNGALHALWRSSYFTLSVDSALLGSSLPAGIEIDVVTRLPPVTLISSGNQVQLHLGALDLLVQHPNLPPDLAVRLGAEAHATVSLVGNDLVFGGIVIDNLFVSTDSINLGTAEQQALEQTLTVLAQQLLNESLNDSLPAFPIPSFTIPSSLSQFGLPAGRQLGINVPALTLQPQHFILRGQFGLRP